jgi:glycosyltransferase involved in cell wall biosynthesis
MGTNIAVQASRCYGLAFGINPMSYILSRLIRNPVDVVHAHSYIFFTSNQAALASRLTGIPLVLHIHGATYIRQPELDKRTRAKLWIKEKFYDPTIGKWTVRSADAIAAVSKFDMQKCQEVFDIDSDRMHLIPNAVDTKIFHPPVTPTGGHVVTYIGRLEAWKGAFSLLEIARRVRKDVPDVQFNFVGDGSVRGKLMRTSEDLRDTVRFLGDVDHQTVASILRSTSVLILPSFIEGLPTVCLEALASGVPVVASNIGGTSEVVIEGETGYLRPPHDLESMSDCVVKLLRDDNLRNRMGQAGRKLVEDGYSWERIAELTEQLYERVAS